MASSLAASDGRRRFIIATGVTKGLSDVGAQKIAESVNSVVRLAVGVFGYERVTSLGLDPTADELRRSIHTFCAKCDPDDVVLIYHTGHADLTSEREHRLWMGDTHQGNPAELLRTRDIAEMALSGTSVRHLLVMLDTCYAARGNADAAMASLAWLERDDHRTFVALSAAHPLEQIKPGQFAMLLERAAHHQASGGTEPQYLHAGVLANHMMCDPYRSPAQKISCTRILDTHNREVFFPNPRYDPTISGRDEYFKQQQEQVDKRRREIHEHFAPRGRGVENTTDQAWRFVGRHAALRDISRWLQGEDSDTRSRIVTGRPGSGKSALLGRLVLLSDKELRGSVPRTQVPADTIPPQESIDVAVHARGKTTTEVREALAAAVGMRDRCDNVGDLLRAVRAQADRTVCAVVDAVDEAVDQHDLVRTLLRPLIDDGPEFGLWLLIGTRNHLLNELGPGALVLDLDTADYSDRQSMVAYSEQNLRETHDESPYRAAEPELVHAVADAVAERANLSFLVAMIVSRTLAAAQKIPDPTDQNWRRSLPSTAAQAMAHDLDTRLRPEDAVKVRHLLTPLAFAYGAGLPWEDIWVPLANRISGQHYTLADVLWLRRTAGSYLVETVEADRSAYRLYHEALAEHVREALPAARVHSTILDFFLEYCDTPRGRQWQGNHHYALTHLSTHAAAAARLGDLTSDPAFLIEAEQSNLLAAFGLSISPSLATTAAVYQLASHHLRDKPRSERASYLELTAHRVGAITLATALRPLTTTHTWSTKWADWKIENPHRVLHAHNGWVTGLARLPARGAYRDMVVSCSDDRTIRFWDVRRGIADGSPLHGHEGQVLAIEVVDLPEHGKLLLVSAGGDNTVRVWDVPSRRQRGEPLTGHQDKVHLVACAPRYGRPLVFSADHSGQIRIWDLLDQRPVEHPITTYLGLVGPFGPITGMVTFVTQDNSHLLIIAHNQPAADRPGRVQVFDVSTGTPICAFSANEAINGIHQATSHSIIVVTDTVIHQCTLQGAVLDTIHHQHTAPVSWSSCTISPQGRPQAITTSTDGTIRTFEPLHGPTGPPLSGSHRHSMSALHMFLDEGRILVVSGSNDGTIRLWDVDNRSAPASNQAAGQVRSIVLDDTDRHETYIYAADKHRVRKWRLRDGHYEGTMGPTNTSIVAMAGAPLSERPHDTMWTYWRTTAVFPLPLIVADKRGGFYCLNSFEPGKPFDGEVDRREVPTQIVHLGQISNRRVLIASTHDSGSVRFQAIEQIPEQYPQRNADKRPYSAWLAVPQPAASVALFQTTVQQLVIGAGDGSIHLWDPRNDRHVRLPDIHCDVVTALAVDGHLLASAADDRAIAVWDLETQKPLLHATNQHVRRIHALAWIPPCRDKGPLLVSGGAEGQLRCWQVHRPHDDILILKTQLTIDLGAPIRAIAPGPDRNAIIGTDHGIAVITLTGF